MVVDVFHTLEYTLVRNHIEGVDRLANLTAVDTGGLKTISATADPRGGVTVGVEDTGVDYTVAVVCEVAGYIVAEVLTDLVPPGGYELDTTVVDLTEVDLPGVDTHIGRPFHCLVLDKVEGLLVIEVE